MNRSQPPWVRVVPNALSIARLALAAALPLSPPGWWAAMIAAAAFTDLADGFAARRFGVASWVGGLLDGVADKVFVLSGILTLAFDGRLALWHVLLLLCRDLTVAALAANAAAIRSWDAFRRMPARVLGKVTTAVIFLMLFTLALAGTTPGVARGVITATALCSVCAAADYLVQFMRAKRNQAAGGWTT